MKKILLVVFFAFLFAKPASAATLYPQQQIETDALQKVNNAIQGERIEDFASNIHINKDGSIDVKETIAYSFYYPRHGIFRNIPFTINNKGIRYDERYTFLPVVDENGKKYQVSRSKDGEQWVLKIGDPNKEIEGKHTYIISYNVKGAIGYFPDHDELYWNVTGTGWDVPIQHASVTITLPEKQKEEDIKLDCFTGGYGSKLHNCTGSTDGQITTIATTLYLNSGEGLTVVEGFPKGIVTVLKPEKFVPFFQRWYGKIVLALLIILAICWYIILPIYIVIKWFREGRDPEVGLAVAAGFDPPKAEKRFLTPAETGTLIDETVQGRDILASIVDLARRGYIKIEEKKKKDFYLHRISKSKQQDKLQPFEQKLLEGIFEEGATIRLKDTILYEAISDIKTTLYKDMVDDGYFKQNPNTTRAKYYALGSVALVTLNFVLAFIAFVFGRLMPKKTLYGAQQASVAKGLKNFLTSQKRQLEFQADKQMMFEKLLPYAVAFGVEKVWAKRFEEFDIKQLDWYTGYDGGAFNAVLFSSSLSHFTRSFSASSTPPSSSGSGFGGGGFSGGGGGGGGGGSW